MIHMKKHLLSILMILPVIGAKAQAGSGLLTDDGSAVVVSGLVLIFLGFFFFLVLIERRLRKAEKRNQGE
jgi:hypothetical protein